MTDAERELNALADILFGGLCDDMDESCEQPWAWPGGSGISVSRFASERTGSALYITDYQTGKKYVLKLEPIT